MRLISEQDVLDRLQEAIDRYNGSEEDDIVSQAILAGLERAKIEVLLSPTEGRK